MNAGAIACLKIVLDDVKPAVRRRIEVPLNIRLDRLHLAIQAAMGWSNSHLYEIRTCDVGWGEPDPDGGEGPLDARKARLIDVIQDVGTKTLRYFYDFGDGWEHTIKIGRIMDGVSGVAYPRLVEATGRCPPEESAAAGATPSSSKRSTTQSMSVMPSGRIGSGATSIPRPSTSTESPKNSQRSPENGRESRQPNGRVRPDPWGAAEYCKAISLQKTNRRRIVDLAAFFVWLRG